MCSTWSCGVGAGVACDVDDARLAGLELDEGALLGDPSDKRRGAMEPPYDYRNDAVLESGGGGAL